MTDARTRGWVENRSSRRVWVAVSDDSGTFFAFPVEPGRSTDPVKNDVDYVRPIDRGVQLVPTILPFTLPRADAWFKVRGGHVRLTDRNAQIGLEELDGWKAFGSRLKEQRNFWTDQDIQNMYNAQPRYFGDHAGLVNTTPIPDFRPGATPVPSPQRNTSSAPANGPETYTVVRGDTLSGIAASFYRTKRDAMLLWPIVYDANRAVIGGNPNMISPGQKLAIPNIGGLSDVELDQIRRRGRNWR